jgi:hypothetical protein
VTIIMVIRCIGSSENSSLLTVLLRHFEFH